MRSRKRPTRTGRQTACQLFAEYRKSHRSLLRPGNSSAAGLNGRLLRPLRRRGQCPWSGQRPRRACARARQRFALPQVENLRYEEEEAVGVPAGCQPAATKSKEGGGRKRPQVENLRYEEEEAVGGARRLPTCGYEGRGHGWPGGRVFRTSGSCRSRASSAGCSRRRCRPAAGPWGRRRSPSGSRAASGSCPSAPSWGRA